ncbi:MAG: exodeoxyribonuclease V beta subunit, partial [Rhodothermales bacterium]
QDLPVFVVGDPKQAIYGFRSGDLETYFAARESTDPGKRFSLLQNWRSDGHMVASVNELFAEDSSDQSDSGRLHRSFATDKIWFPPAQAALPDGSNARPLTIELIDTADGKAFNKTDGETVAVELTATRIKELLDGDANILPRDIAVLVQKHAEARLIKAALGESGIPAVLQSAGKVFDSYEAVDFKLVLAAMLDPSDLAAVRAALATPLFGITARQLLVGDDGVAAESIQQAATVFGDAHHEWVRSSFLVGFNRIAHGLGMQLHLLKAEDGERRLTNVVQIAEILERVARDQKLGMQATRRWLDRQLDADSRVDEDAHEIRLESDDDAVTVMTVFKSKGLQFPHVFAPFMWSKQPTKNRFTNCFEYHEGVGANSQLILDLDIKNLLQQEYDVEPERRHEDEKLGEQLRLLYVAVTRAQHSMHLVGGRLGSDQRHALHYLLSREECPAQDEPIVNSLEMKIDPSALEKSGANLVIRQEECAPRPSGVGAQSGAALAPKRTDLTAPEVMTGSVDTSWQILSFSKLADHGYQPRTLSADALRDYDDTVEIENADYATREALSRNPDTLFSFVGGTKTGNCWHAIFEYMDFMATDTHRDVVIEWATRFRLIRDLDKVDNDPRSQKNRQINTLCGMVRDVLTLKLPDCPVTLADVSLRHRLAEMQFDFPVPETGVSRQIIAQCLLDSDWERKDEFADILNAWIAPATDEDELPLMRGFMTGFIDLIFRDAVDGKYYILDWKSNSLGGTYAGFTPAGITEEMGRNRYFFQYLLYSVALHHYLSATLPSYDYNDHFGGAYYVFLRGVTPPPAFEGDWDASEHSVYYDRPSLDVINRLSTALGQFNGGSHAVD